MQKGINQFLVFMTVFAVVLTSFINTTSVYADDGTNTGEPSSGEEQPAVDEETVEEVMAQIPEGTELVVLDETATPEPLASQAAADIIVNGDPMWCPDGVLPGAPSCTGSFTAFTGPGGLLTALAGGAYTGNGVIYVESTYNSALESGDVNIDGSVLTGLGNLTIQGGWDEVLNGTFISGTSTFTGISLNIFNWAGSVTLNDLNINAQNNNAGLYVQTGGNIALDNITSSDNALGRGADLNTCMFDGTQCTGTGNVTVTGSVFDDNGSSGIRVDSGGTLDLNGVTAIGNDGAGALLYNHDLQGAGGVQITNGLFNANDDNGIYIIADDNITLTKTNATGNDFDGVDLINYEGTGNVSVNGGNFSGNHNVGLYVISAGDVTIASVTANDNNNGAIIFTDDGVGDVDISASVFNDNTWNGLEVTSSGDITLDDVDASDNYVGGAYLHALSGTGDISVVNGSQFNGNEQYGLRGFANGDITLANVTVNGSGDYDTEEGAWLKSFEGNISVTDSVFTNNLDYGLLAVAAGTVDLVNVTATFNGGDGVAVYSIYNFACFGDDNILISVDSGTYTDNGGYGIYAYPGELGSLTLNNSPVFAPNANALGDTFVELLSNPCPEPEKPVEEGDGKEPNVVEVPEDGTSGPVEQNCELYSSTEFYLHSGTTVKVDCPFSGTGEVTDTPQANLPDDLPEGLIFADAATVALDSEGNPITVLDSGLITLTFTIPDELMGKRFSILYWDPTAKDGQGDWIELPFDQFGGAYFPLYPDNPDDGRLLCSGFTQSGNTVTVTVNFPGTFVLVAR